MLISNFDSTPLYLYIQSIQEPPYAFLRNDKFLKKDLNNITNWEEGIYSMPEGKSNIQSGGDGSPDWDSTAFNMILVNETEKYLTNHLESKPEVPFFTYVALGSVHLPHSPPDRYFNGPIVAGKHKGSKHKDLLYEMDLAVGSLIKMLEEKDVIQDTIIIFASDNGGLGSKAGGSREASGPLRAYKGTVYEGGHRIPMTIRWDNGDIPKGETRSHLVGLNDVFASLCDLTGIKVPPGQAVDSVSFANYALDETKQEGLRESIGIWKIDAKGVKASAARPRSAALRKGNMKLIYEYKTDVTELYDLTSDISEKTNIAAEYPDLVQEMHAELRRIGPCYDQQNKFVVFNPYNNSTKRKGCRWFQRKKNKRCRQRHEGLAHCGLTCKAERHCDSFLLMTSDVINLNEQ